MLNEGVCAESGKLKNQSRPPSFVYSCDSHWSTWSDPFPSLLLRALKHVRLMSKLLTIVDDWQGRLDPAAGSSIYRSRLYHNEYLHV